MAESSGEPTAAPAKPNIIEELVDAGTTAFNPQSSSESQKQGRERYDAVIERTDTWTLLHALNALIQPGAAQPWLRPAFMQSLTLIPQRKDGVRATMELVFMVHPSSTGQPGESKEPQKQGSSITHEAVAVATKLLSTVPAGMPAKDWFQGISGQLFSLLDGEAGPDLSRTAAQIIGFGILGRREFGAPGSLGWDIFVQPIIFDINPTLCEESGLPIQPRSEEVIDLTRGQELVTPANLTRAVRRLGILILSNPSPGLCKRLLTRVLPQLWAIASLPSSSKKISEEIKTPAHTMLQTYFQLFGGLETTLLLIQNLTCRGSLPGAKTAWQFVSRQDTASIELLRQSSDMAVDWGNIENTARQFVELFTNSSSKENVSSIFLQLLQKWIETTKTPNSGSIEVTMQDSTSEASISELYEITVLQQLMEQVPEKLVGHFDQLLDLVCQIFVADEQAHLGEDVVGVVLSLLNLVITAPTFQKSTIKPENLSIIEHALTKITQREKSESAATARNLALLLKYRDELDEDEDKTSMPSAQQVEDRKTYNLAMSYITGGKDNPPPVVSEGLNLLSGLITSQSSILDINAVTVLLSNLLKENEDYINLRVVKMFTLLAAKHPKSTLREIVDNYLDASEKSTTDTRLRFGEALVQVIEKLGELFTGEAARHTSETLLSIAGRRGHRPKTLGKQERDEKLRKMKQERAQRQGVKDEPEDSDQGFDEEELTEEQKVSNDILAQIVQGWESKRGSEDIRMRTSALSIFSSALETNIRGIGATLVSAGVDLCLNILAMEPGIEAGILRRAAIIVILGFVKALNEAKESGRTLGFGLTESSRADIQRTLEYVAATDTDGLVQQHARDVVDSLENWQMVSLLPTTQESSMPGLAGLAGLAVNPIIGGSQAGGTTTRPRIEEIE